MADINRDRDDVTTLATALDHVLRLYEFRMTSGLQVLNFFLLASAVLAAAYVSALNDRLFGVAGVIAMVGLAASGATYIAGRRQSDMANLAAEPLKELQDRLAAALEMDSLRVVQRYRTDHTPRWYGGRITAHLMFPMMAALCLAAAAYAWSH
jgi:hypothetical protein